MASGKEPLSWVYWLDEIGLTRGGGVFMNIWAHVETCVLEHAVPLSVTAVYEVSGENFPPTDLQEICWAVSFSISTMEPPQ
jgi:hypothetical protein